MPIKKVVLFSPVSSPLEQTNGHSKNACILISPILKSAGLNAKEIINLTLLVNLLYNLQLWLQLFYCISSYFPCGFNLAREKSSIWDRNPLTISHTYTNTVPNENLTDTFTTTVVNVTQVRLPITPSMMNLYNELEPRYTQI